MSARHAQHLLKLLKALLEMAIARSQVFGTGGIGFEQFEQVVARCRALRQLLSCSSCSICDLCRISEVTPLEGRELLLCSFDVPFTTSSGSLEGTSPEMDCMSCWGILWWRSDTEHPSPACSQVKLALAVADTTSATWIVRTRPDKAYRQGSKKTASQPCKAHSPLPTLRVQAATSKHPSPCLACALGQSIEAHCQ